MTIYIKISMKKSERVRKLSTKKKNVIRYDDITMHSEFTELRYIALKVPLQK